MILNQQRAIRVPVAPLERFLARTRKRLKLAPDSLTIALVSNEDIARWNRSYRGKNRPTDVLSFPVEPDSPKPNGRRSRKKSLPQSPRTSATNTPKYLGDIAIAPAVARDNAARDGRTFDVEMRILILHGILHLMGYDHETDTGQMDRRESRLRRELGLA